MKGECHPENGSQVLLVLQSDSVLSPDVKDGWKNKPETVNCRILPCLPALILRWNSGLLKTTTEEVLNNHILLTVSNVDCSTNLNMIRMNEKTEKIHCRVIILTLSLAEIEIIHACPSGTNRKSASTANTHFIHVIISRLNDAIQLTKATYRLTCKLHTLRAYFRKSQKEKTLCPHNGEKLEIH
jgi:hypothetical protein